MKYFIMAFYIILILTNPFQLLHHNMSVTVDMRTRCESKSSTIYVLWPIILNPNEVL